MIGAGSVVTKNITVPGVYAGNPAKKNKLERYKKMYVKFNDLSRIHKPIIKSSMSSFKKVVENSQFVLNKDIQNFENEYADFTGQKYALGCANGTDALEIILRGLDIGAGDEVIIPVNTFIATALAVSRTLQHLFLLTMMNFI